jgi:hypothetical protein
VEQHPCYERIISEYVTKSPNPSKSRKRRRSSTKVLETKILDEDEKNLDEEKNQDKENNQDEAEETEEEKLEKTEEDRVIESHFDTLLGDDSIPYIA